ncbi:MAG: Ig domain-containing protein [Myxococcales bacterium]
MNRTTLLLALVSLAACSSTTPLAGNPDAAEPQSLCNGAKPTCIGAPEYVLECREDAGWGARKCDDGLLCWQGECQELNCVPSSKQCKDGGVRTCTTDGQGWSDPVACASGTVCDEGACKTPVCTPDAVRCAASGAPERCNAGGTAWIAGGSCSGGTSCIDGACLPSACKSGDKACGQTTLYSCDASGKWTSTPCPDGQGCMFGKCVACVSSETCQSWESCTDGACVATTPEIVTPSISGAQVGTPYSFVMTAKGGKTPYSWSLSSGALPNGLTLAADGSISGTAAAPGTATAKFKVTDALAATSEKEFALEVSPKGVLTITTKSLAEATAGDAYDAKLTATGGQAPYFWGVISGQLPTGIDLFSTGALSGTTEVPGTYTVTFRVADSLTPPGHADKELTLNVKIGDLVITSDQQIVKIPFVNLYIVTLPTLIQYVPYSGQLTAKGGLKPYKWEEQDAPDLSLLGLTKWGLPSGLSLGTDGKVSGWVTDISDATTVKIPLGPTYTGYFIYVQVSDTQNPADTAKAVVCLPTIPVF